MLAFTVETIYFYAANPDRPSDTVADTLKAALSKMLVHYDFLAGRVRLNEELMRMEIDRNDAGAQFSTASCDLALAELGDVSEPNPLFRKFVPQAHNATTVADIPLMMIQVSTHGQMCHHIRSQGPAVLSTTWEIETKSVYLVVLL